MITDSPAQTILSEDVKEALYLARRQSVRGRSSTEPSTVQLLLALLKVMRPFSRLDALLRIMDVNVGELKSALNKVRREAPESLINAEIVLERAQELAGAEQASEGSVKAHVQVEHIWLAACQKGNNELLQALSAAGITENTLTTAKADYKKPGPLSLKRSWFYGGLYFFREAVEMVVVVTLFLIIIKEGFGELRLIPSESMLDTLKIGDRLVIEKVSRWFRPYERGDILVFYPPPPNAVLPNDPISVFLRLTGFSSLLHNTADDPVDKAYIKRLVAMPGETIQVIPGDGVYVNGQRLNEPYTKEVAYDCGYFCMPVTVPDDHYFMMGDNRNQSKDSRYFGFQPVDRVIGRAFFRVLPVDRIGELGQDIQYER